LREYATIPAMADSAGLALPVFPTAATREVGLSRAWVALALGAITALAAALRLIALGKVGHNPFYDAAVRSMDDSLRNFFFGAYEPGGSVSIDKPPVDLWLQVTSVKLLGFNDLGLKLPEALGGTLAVPLLFDAVRRVFGTAAGLSAALALAILPAAVLTSRSDTMDAVMGLLLVAALWSLIRAAQTRRSRWIMIAALCVGVAFNVKLLEAFVPVPAFAVGAWLASTGSRGRRIRTMALALVVLLAVSLSWLTATSIVGSEPYAIGSTNGSPWNAAFVFNGLDRIGAAPAVKAPAKVTATAPAVTAPATTTPAAPVAPHPRDLDVRLHITPPGPTRLLARSGALPAPRLGLELLAALLLGIPALWARRRESASARVAAVSLGLWILTGAVFFSTMSRLHPRYVEAVSPAIAAGVGIGIAWLATARGRRPLFAGALAIALAVYAVWASFGDGLAIVGLGATILGVTCLVWAAFGRATRNTRAARLAPWGVALVVGGLLAAPLTDAVNVVNARLSDAGRPGAMPHERVLALSRFLTANRDGTRYEFASAGATQAGELIVHDGQPVRILTTFNGRPLISTRTLAREVARGDVRYALLGGFCTTYVPTSAVCSKLADWVRNHGVDVSKQVGVYGGLVWMLGPQALKLRAERAAAHARSRHRRAHLIAIARHHLGPVALRHRRALESERRAARRRQDRHRADHDHH
jgi:4-amino-4-deoxy-L-arabinose transferase-like glycosyltransferase